MSTRCHRWSFAGVLTAVFLLALGCPPPEETENDNDQRPDGPSVEISSNISDETVWTADTVYRVTDEVEVSAPLEIEPGTYIEFEEFAGLELSSGSEITFEGEEDNPIRFTGTEQETGHWMGIHVHNTTFTGNTFDHVIVEYGGADAMHDSLEPANLQISQDRAGSNDTELALTNTVLRHSGGHGLHIEPEGEFTEFSSNEITDNTEAPVSIYADKLDSLDADSTYAGNGDDAIVTNSWGVGGEPTWQNLDVPYRIKGQYQSVSGDLTIEAGTEIEFVEFAGLELDSGRFTVEGQDDDPIVFTGTEQEAGHWAGVHFHNTTESGNAFDHVVIEYAGSEAMHDSLEPANLQISQDRAGSNDTEIALTNSVLRDGEGYGLSIEAEGRFTEFSSNEIVDNAEAPVSAYGHHLDALDAETTYAGNGDDAIVTASWNVGGEPTWENLDVPYRIEGQYQSVSGDLTIEAGTTLEFAEFAGLELSSGAFDIRGDEDDEIVFTGTEQEAGHWAGIHFHNTTNQPNEFEHVVIEYAGSEAMHDSHEPASLFVAQDRAGSHDTEIEVRESTFSDSAGHGISIIAGESDWNDDIDTVNDFEDIADEDVFVID